MRERVTRLACLAVVFFAACALAHAGSLDPSSWSQSTIQEPPDEWPLPCIGDLSEEPIEPETSNVATPSRASIITGSYGFKVRRATGPLPNAGAMDPLVLIGGVTWPDPDPDLDDEPTTLPFQLPTPFWGPREWVLGVGHEIAFNTGDWYIAETSLYATIWKNDHGGVFAGGFWVAPQGQVVHTHPNGWGNGGELWSVLPLHDDYNVEMLELAMFAPPDTGHEPLPGGGDPGGSTHGGCALTGEIPGAPPCYTANGVSYLAKSGCTQLASISPKTGAKTFICYPGGSECKMWVSCGATPSGFYCTECDHPGLAGVSFTFSPGGSSSWCGYSTCGDYTDG